MKPKEYERAKKKSSHYGFQFDINVDTYLPPDIIVDDEGLRWLTGPLQYPRRGKRYYQSQCLFRLLKTQDTIHELQERLESRDKSKDAGIKKVHDRILKSIRSHEIAVAREAAEPWWRDPTRTLDEKISFILVEPWRRASKTIMCSRHPATYSVEALLVSTPGRILKEADCTWATSSEKQRPLRRRRQNYRLRLRRKSARQTLRVRTEAEAKKAQQKARQNAQQKALLADAMRMPDWDPTGTWSIRCEKLSTYMYGRGAPQKSTMQIWRDDFRFDKMCEDDEDGVPEEEEMDDADDEIDEEAYDPWDDEEIENFPWGQQSHSKKPAEKNAHLPRFCAKFHFAVVEGVMRIVPPESTRQQFPKTFLIKNNRCFE
ncbi:hypothetical protein CLAFUR0_13192 [Fulvia fulva]|nr:hypothetical protein CLAFUR0_13192 [Fulvia fulva]